MLTAAPTRFSCGTSSTSARDHGATPRRRETRRPLPGRPDRTFEPSWLVLRGGRGFPHQVLSCLAQRDAANSLRAQSRKESLEKHVEGLDRFLGLVVRA